MQWFKHDSDASQDAKLQNVLLDHGLEGYGLYWYCLELIVGKIDADNITFELEHDARIIARNTGSTAEKVENMMRYFVSQGLFEASTLGRVKCSKLAKRLDKSMTSNPKMRALIEKVREKNHDAVMINHDSVMALPDLVMQDKNRIDKSKSIDDSIESPVDFVSKEFDRFWKYYPVKKSKVPAKRAFVAMMKGKKESTVKMLVDLILSYHHDCIDREEIGADKLHPSTLLNQKRWEDDPEYCNAFKREWIDANKPN